MSRDEGRKSADNPHARNLHRPVFEHVMTKSCEVLAEVLGLERLTKLCCPVAVKVRALCQDEATLRASLDVERSLIAELAANLALLLTYYCCCGLLDRNATLESRARLENSLHLHF